MNSIERFRATYNFERVDHLFRREFYIWDEAIERWRKEGMPADVSESELFGFDELANVSLEMLGWCEPAFAPAIEEKVIETSDSYEIVRDDAGRIVKYLKGQRHGFMPTYLKHAVKDDKDWEEDIAPLLLPDTPQRWDRFEEKLAEMKQADEKGVFVTQKCIGGYMYLRSLLGPEGVCYMFMDNPDLIHKMMSAWLELADQVTARVQEYVELDELFMAEDICYNHGLLVSPNMVREFLFPYYQQLIANIRARQRNKHLFLQIDTDGNCNEAISLYTEVGMEVMSPFEIAAGNGIIEVAEKYPSLIMSGGIDKRVLAEGADAIDSYLNRVIPFMVKRGGYIPTCDHGVPDNVSFSNYMHYRRRIMALDH